MAPKEALQNLCSYIKDEAVSADSLVTTSRRYEDLVDRNYRNVRALCSKMNLVEIIEVAETVDIQENPFMIYLLGVFCEIIASQVYRYAEGNEIDRFAKLLEKLDIGELDRVASLSTLTEDASRCISNEYAKRGIMFPA